MAIIIAHRGYSSRFGDNNWKSIKEAFVNGSDMCEVDLQVTKDGVIVLYHDYTVGGKRIAEMTFNEFKSLCPDNPTLEALLEWSLKEKKPFLLEVKDRRMVENLKNILKDFPEDLVMVGSFDGVFLKEFKRKADHIQTCFLLGSVTEPEEALTLTKKYNAEFLLLAWENRHPFPQDLIPDTWIEQVKQRGVEIILWHEEREDVLVDLVEKDVYGICTNDPPLLRRILDARSCG